MKHTVTGQSDRPHRSPAAARVPSRSSKAASVSFTDNRPEAIAQRRLTNAIHHSPYMVAQRQQLHGMFGEAAPRQGGPEEAELLQGQFDSIQRKAPEEEELLQGKFATVQRKSPEVAELLQGKLAPVQRQGEPGEEELLQGKFAPVSSMQMKDATDKPNASTQLSTGNTGLPDQLKAGIESLSGMSLDHVKVHYNSAQPAQLNALAYTQGTDIHVAQGQEQHLPHEAWHVVQQVQGRVKPTTQMKDGVPVNDDAGLEHEADVMGTKAVQMRSPNDPATGAGAKALLGVQRTGETREPSQKQGDASGEKGRLNFLFTNPKPNHGRVVQRLNGSTPQNFAVNNAAADSVHLTIQTDKAWTSSTGVMSDLSDIEMREHITFNHNPVQDIPSYPAVVNMVPNMVLAGNILTKVAGAMQGGGGSDNHSGAGFGLSFTVAGVPNLTKGLWTLIGDQVYEYRDRGAAGPWTPLHAGHFTITRTMSVDPATHHYSLTFSKVGPGVNVTAGPTPIRMSDTEAIQGNVALRPDQAVLWTDADNEIRTAKEQHYQQIGTDNPVINGVALPVEYQITTPNAHPVDPNNATFAPFLTIPPAEYAPMLANARAGLTTMLNEYMTGLPVPPTHVYIIFTKLSGAIRQQGIYSAGGGGVLRIIFRFDKFTQISAADKSQTMPGKVSKGGVTKEGKVKRWQKATVIHEMGHLLHAFTSPGKFSVATINGVAVAGAAQTALNNATAAAAPLAPTPDQIAAAEVAMGIPEMAQMAATNQQLMTALNGRGYDTKWTYAQDNPAEVVAEVWTALMHGEKVPRGLAAVYLGYGGMRNATIDRTLRKLFPGKVIPALNEPIDALHFI